ncbi:MAG: ABC transporter permease [Chloroflexota bacterium]
MSIYSIVKPKSNFSAFQELIQLLTRHRELAFEMAVREIKDRYAGQYLGLFWTFGHPLIIMGVYIVIFGVVFKARVGDTVDVPLGYTVYLLSGLIPWLAMADLMGKSGSVVEANANLVKQVIFPIEVLPVKSVLASLLTEAIFLVLLTVYILVTHGLPSRIYLLLPLLIVLQSFAMIGIGYILSAVGVFFRDIKDFVQVFTTVGVYLMPTFFLPSVVPDILRPLFYINPFSYMVWCFQDVLFFGRFEHPWAWGVFFCLSLFTFVFGYRVFRRLKDWFANVL